MMVQQTNSKTSVKLFVRASHIYTYLKYCLCAPERFINYDLFMWTGVLRKISIPFQAKRTGNMVCTMLLAAVLHFAQAPMCSVSQLSLLVFNRKSSRTPHRSAPVLQNEFGNCPVAASKIFSKYLANYIIQQLEGT